MATQIVIPSPADFNYEAVPIAVSAETATAKPRRSCKNLRGSIGIVALYVVAATVEALVPKFRFLAVQLPIFAAPALVAVAVGYMRDFHPEKLAVLEPDSPLLLKLQRIKKALGWISTTTIVLAAAALFAASISNSCTCEDHPVLFIVWLVPTLLSPPAFLGLSAYIRERTRVPVVLKERGWYNGGRRISEYKPFHSEHWGER